MAGKKLFLTALIAMLLALTLGGIFIGLYLQQRSIERNLSELRRELRDETDSTHSNLKKLDLNQQLLFRNLNESRDVLKLPSSKAVPVFSDPEEKGTPGSEVQDGQWNNIPAEEDFFRGVRYFSDFYMERQLTFAMEKFLRRDSTSTTLKDYGLILEQKEKSLYLLRSAAGNGRVIFLLQGRFDGQSPVIQVTSVLKREYTVFLDGKDIRNSEKFLDFLSEEKKRIDELRGGYKYKIEQCSELIASAQVGGILESKKLKAVLPGNDVHGNIFSGEIHISNSDGETQKNLLSFGVRYPSNLFFIERDTYRTTTEFREALVTKLRELDTRSEQEIRVDASLEGLKKLARDPAFTAYLDEMSLLLDDEPRDDGDYYYFDLNRRDGSRYGAFAVLKKYGDIYLTDREDLVISSLKAIDSASRIGQRHAESFFQTEGSGGLSAMEDLSMASKISEAGSKEESILLLCGTHEKNADTIMIARMAEGKVIRLLSVPRDIYYRGKKLNSHYRDYGMERLKGIIGELTGLEFDGYISVDMYAFIDVINLLKGIEITLEEALIDPTYRVRVNGEWSTLYYPAGTHHLSGIEALRVVRSRHTSDDFDRSYRQQLVLRALLDRMNRIHAGKLKEVYDLFQILYRYVETDLSAYDLVQYYLRYHEADVQARKSISTDNILYTTYSNLYYAGLTEDEVDEDFYKGAWILLPEDDDWELLEGFVRMELYGE